MEITLIKDRFFAQRSCQNGGVLKSLHKCDLFLKFNQENPVYDHTQANLIQLLLGSMSLYSSKEEFNFICKPSLKEARRLLTYSVSLVLYILEPFGKEPTAILNDIKIEFSS